jgi:hypothetical protein
MYIPTLLLIFKKYFLKRLPGVGSEPGSSGFHLFSHFHHFTAEPQRLPNLRSMYIVKRTIAAHAYIGSRHEYKKIETNCGSALKVTRNEKINKIKKDPGFVTQVGQPI